MREIVLDTETTGLDPADGHRVLEIGAIEIRLEPRCIHTNRQQRNPLDRMPGGQVIVVRAWRDMVHVIGRRPVVERQGTRVRK